MPNVSFGQGNIPGVVERFARFVNRSATEVALKRDNRVKGPGQISRVWMESESSISISARVRVSELVQPEEAAVVSRH